jgi:hypothetical protein
MHETAAAADRRASQQDSGAGGASGAGGIPQKSELTRELKVKNDKKSICNEEREKRDCETVKLWLQVVDSEGSTVSQIHSFTKGHGGVGRNL